MCTLIKFIVEHGGNYMQKQHGLDDLLPQFRDIILCTNSRPVSICHIFSSIIRFITGKRRFPFKHLHQKKSQELKLTLSYITLNIYIARKQNYLIQNHCKGEHINLLIISPVFENFRSHIAVFKKNRRKF